MAGSQSRDDGDYFPFAFESSQSLPQPQSSSKSARSLTPRGPLFTDLGEAHRNITSRLGSNNPFKKPSGEDSSTPSILTRDASTSSFGQPIIKPTNTPPQDAVDMPRPTTLDIGRSLTKSRSVSSGTSPLAGERLPKTRQPELDVVALDDILGRKIVAEVNSQPPHNSSSTVEKIYDQYATGEGDHFSSSLASSSQGYTLSTVPQTTDFEPFSREGAATRCGFRGEESRGPRRKVHEKAIREACYSAQLTSDEKEADSVQHRFQPESSPSQPPRNSLPLIPPNTTKPSSSLGNNEGSSQPPDSSVSNSQHLLDVEAQVAEIRLARRALVPLPLRIPSNRGMSLSEQYKHDDFFSDAGSSIADNTAQSNDDPFRYDNEGYQAFLRPGMERDISQALKRISRAGLPAEGTFVSPEGSPCGKTTESQSNRNAASDLDTSPKRGQRPEGNFFDLSAFQSASNTERRVRDIKVVINRKPQMESDDEEYYDTVDELKGQGTKINGIRGKLQRDPTSDGDWVTEATSEVGFGGDSAPTGQHLKQSLKATGSSIADYSDDEDAHHHEPFGSRDQILQHPVGDAQSESYEIRNLKDTKQPVFLPKSRNHRVNEFPENSLRLYSTSTKDDTGNVLPPLTRKWSNPFRRNSYNRAGANSHFPYKAEKKGPSKYEFRDSASEYAPAIPSNQATCGTNLGTHASLPSPGSGVDEVRLSAVDAQFNQSAELEADSSRSRRFSTQRDAYATPQHGHKTRGLYLCHPGDYREREKKDLGEQHFATATSFTSEEEPLSAASKFEFELLPLDLAQVKYKKQRDSGETDETETAEVRIKRAKSTSSSRPFMASSPIEPPLPARVREARIAHDLSSNFTPPSWRSLRDALQDTPTPLMATGLDETSPSSNAGRPRRPVDSVLESPLTPATNYTDTPTTVKNGWFGHDVPRLLPVKGPHSRNVTDRTQRCLIGSTRATSSAVDEGYITQTAQSQRKCWFYMMAALSILPFFAILVLTGVFNDSLAWFTQGEVYQLTHRQRKFIKYMLLVECIVYTACIAAIVVFFVTKSKVPF